MPLHKRNKKLLTELVDYIHDHVQDEDNPGLQR